MQEVQHSSDILAKVTGALQKTNLFSGLSPDILNQLVNKATLIRFEAQDVVVTTGGPSDSFFVVIAGEVIVLKGMPDSGTELCRLGASETIGEMGVLLGESRSASVVAHKPSLLMRLDAATFDRMFDKVPGFGKAIAKELSQRLSEASAQMALPLYDKDVGTISNEVRALIPLELVQRHRVLPLEIKGNQLLIGLVDDPTSQTINAIKTHLPSMELQQVRVTAHFLIPLWGKQAD